MTKTHWRLNSYECYEAPAVTVLFYHNQYEGGKQGGFEIIQRNLRIAGNGNLRMETAPGQWGRLPQTGPRRASKGGEEINVEGKYEDGLTFSASLRPEGEVLLLSIDLHSPLPEDWIGKAGFNLELIPGIYMGKSYLLDEKCGIFPRQFDAPMLPSPSGNLEPQPMARGRKLIIAPDDPAIRVEIESLSGELSLLDGRAYAQNGWFVIRGVIPGESRHKAVEWRITPGITPGWIRPPVIGYSQIGYHPQQKKVATIELDLQVTRAGQARLLRLNLDGGEEEVKTANLEMWGEYLCYHYALFDFSEIHQPGLYRLEFADHSTAPFPIQSTVYQDGAWQPTLETYFPAQMCHMEVRDVHRIWHGACHLDDALQAPLNHQHFDGYHQCDKTDTPYIPLQHIPYLNRGGWHDAGDYDLAAGSQASTTLTLALARENFGLDSDQTTVKRDERKVILHTPDGIPDIIQQIIHGVENLLSGYRAAGHSFAGIIESKILQYVHLGDPATMTDNLVCEGESDDRWAFTNHDTALEYFVCAAMAASSRVLRDWDVKLAAECLETAQKIWDFEHTHPSQEAPNAYTPRHPERQEILAAVELFLATEEGKYRQTILEKTDLICREISALGGAAARALPRLQETAFAKNFRAAAASHAERLAAEASRNPFGVPYTADTWRSQSPVWGVAWSFLDRSISWYFLRQAFPDLFPCSLLTDTLGYVLGCHPVSNVSLVSGVGSSSLTSAYGTNRADWSFIPGGVASGPALLRPNYPELHDPFPFLWQQKEYVMGGAATYLFLVLAVNRELT